MAHRRQHQRHASFSLELEAADYFKLDLGQVNMFNKMMPTKRDSGDFSRLSGVENEGSSKVSTLYVPNSKSFKTNQHRKVIQGKESSNLELARRNEKKLKSYDIYEQDTHSLSLSEQVASSATYIINNNSSTSSTNSLPSISSSPSVSPSLLCPHLTINDILQKKSDFNNKSPHTIGLCPKCRLDPPPNIQSPLSPIFKPSSFSVSSNKEDSINKMKSRKVEPLFKHQQQQQQQPGKLKRGYSDHQVSSKSKSAKNERRMQFMKNKQDDSLDYYLKPNDLRKLQMSPTLRHSVEYMRRNSIESGRILKIYKNGQAYDKPLRICIMRGEFATLNHLLDYINSRQVIPSGARYLFHLDGSLVYSVNELKHGHAYIVSGTRVFDFNANKLLKERHLEDISKQPRATEEARSRSLCSSREDLIFVSDKREEKSELDLVTKIKYKQNNISKQRESVSKQNNQLNSRHSSQSNESSLNSTRVIQPPIKYKKTKLVQSAKSDKSSNQNSKLASKDEGLQKKKITATNRMNKTKLISDSTNKTNNFVSEENLTIMREHSPEIRKIDNQVTFSRAKSELAGLPAKNKRKKNVTFFDSKLEKKSPTNTGHDISSNLIKTSNELNPAIKTESSSQQHSIPTQNRNSLSNSSSCGKESTVDSLEQTNEIGIQVSESIDGFLIDLPIAMPFKGDEKKEFLRKGTRGIQPTLNGRTNQVKTNQGSISRKSKAQIVTITERQLSPNELNELKDLDQGDHHSEKHKIKNNEISLALEETKSLGEESIEESQLINQKEVKIQVDTQIKNEQITGKRQNKTKATKKLSDNSKLSSSRANLNNWQYPGGRVASASPVERPVSQNNANETVHARVTTPTPSLSTNGDTNSLTMAYELSNFGSIYEETVAFERDSAAREELKTIEKNILPVEGKLVSGDFPPNRNFQLIWVNGFSINDKYPENSSSGISLASQMEEQEKRSLLSPGSPRQITIQQAQFKPSERFANWVSYSKKFHELIYPAGSFIVLWCRVTNEQRFYMKHTSSISCLTLASLDPDLAASGQINDIREKVPACVHLWSLKSLATLKIIDEDLFKNQTIFSLELKNTLADGYELFIGAKDDKKLTSYASYSKLNADNKQLDESGLPRAIMKGTKLIQANQQPLLLTKLSNIKSTVIGDIYSTQRRKSSLLSELSLSNKKDKQDNNKFATEDQIVLVFGRKYFDLWACDLKQSKLNLIQVENKDLFSDVISKANSIVRMSPKEFLVADLDGRLSLLDVNITKSSTSTPSKSFSGLDTQKYSVNLINLKQINSGEELNNNNSATGKQAYITCLARITGNLFVSGDSNCVIKFCKIKRQKWTKTGELSDGKKKELLDESECTNLSSINLPTDLGFICSLMVSDYDRKKSIVNLFIISTNNVILFGSIQLPPSTFDVKTNDENDNNNSSNNNNNNNVELEDDKIDDKRRKENKLKLRQQMLQNSYLSVVYEGHETSVMSLVADIPKASEVLRKNQSTKQTFEDYYFTCSIDCKICKWNGKNLIWKSMLPSACASLAVHPLGSVLAIGSADGTVYILDKVSGLLISYFPITPVCINCLSYSIDGTFLAAGCANGSIFILPVYERGLKYKKVSIFQSPYPVMSLQFSTNNQYILTSVVHGSYQELILWDLPNFRYMRENVRLTVDQIEWFDSICSGSEDVRAIWENANLDNANATATLPATPNSKVINSRKSKAMPTTSSTFQQPSKEAVSRTPQQVKQQQGNFVVNLSCHRLIRSKLLRDLAFYSQPGDLSRQASNNGYDDQDMNLVIASDNKGYLRLFRYPCNDIKQAFYEIRLGSSGLNCCRFLAFKTNSFKQPKFVTASTDGSIYLWSLKT